MQITIQKKFLILCEIAENVYAMFLIIVNFVFNFIVESAEELVNKAKQAGDKFAESFDSIKTRTFNFIRALFGFNIYKLRVLKIETKTSEQNKHFKNNDFLIYSNLLAPPANS